MVRSVLDAPGKLAVVNIASAGSPVAMPKLTVGTNCWLASHTPACVNEAPKLRLCLPLIQFSVSSNTRVLPSRELLVEVEYGLAMLLNALMPRAYPP